MRFGKRYPGGNLNKTWPLAVSLAAHVVLALAWLYLEKTERPVDETPRTLSVLLLPKAAPALPTVTPPDKKAPANSRRSQPSAARVLPAASAAPSLPVEPVVAAPVPAPAAATRSALDILDAARQDIRKHGAGARDGKAGAPLQADGKWDRFADSVAGARVDNSPGPVTESYTSPDGLTYYRTRVGDKVACRKTGSTGPPAPWRSEEAIRAGAGSMATLGVGNSAGTTLCPGGQRDWVRN